MAYGFFNSPLNQAFFTRFSQKLPAAGFVVILMYLAHISSAQNCTGCTAIISGSSAAAMSLGTGDVLCITTTGVYTGDLTLNGGTLCNEGSVNSNITINSGAIDNYGVISANNSPFQQNGGDIVNNGSFSVASDYTYNGDSFTNNGNLTISGDFSNGDPGFVNNATMNVTGSFFANDDFTNNFELTISTDLEVNGGTFDNNGTLVVEGDAITNNVTVNINPLSRFIVNGSLTNNNRRGILNVFSLISVGVNFTNNGTVNGGGGTCGRIDVTGTTTNNSSGDFGITGLLDLCDGSSGGGGGFDVNFGSVGGSVTNCVCNVVLPIELGFFDAQLTDDRVKLSWATLSEENNDFFSIERAPLDLNGEYHWEVISKVAGAGDSDIPLDYVHFDDSPLTGRAFYRLKQTDFDGQFSYSQIVSVIVPPRVTLYPNPVHDFFTFEGPSKPEKFAVFDTWGRLQAVTWELVPHGIRVDMRGLNSGVYLVRTAIEGFPIHKSIFKVSP